MKFFEFKDDFSDMPEITNDIGVGKWRGIKCAIIKDDSLEHESILRVWFNHNTEIDVWMKPMLYADKIFIFITLSDSKDTIEYVLRVFPEFYSYMVKTNGICIFDSYDRFKYVFRLPPKFNALDVIMLHDINEKMGINQIYRNHPSYR